MTTTDCRDAFETLCDENEFEPRFDMWVAFQAAWNTRPHNAVPDGWMEDLHAMLNASPTASAEQTGGQGEEVAFDPFCADINSNCPRVAKLASDLETAKGLLREGRYVELFNEHQQCVEVMKGAVGVIAAMNQHRLPANWEFPIAVKLAAQDAIAQLTNALRGMGVES